MDLARKQRVKTILDNFLNSFKPCCNGFSSEAMDGVDFTYDVLKVSNLVVMDLARKP